MEKTNETALRQPQRKQNTGLCSRDSHYCVPNVLDAAKPPLHLHPQTPLDEGNLQRKIIGSFSEGCWLSGPLLHVSAQYQVTKLILLCVQHLHFRQIKHTLGYHTTQQCQLWETRKLNAILEKISCCKQHQTNAQSCCDSFASILTVQVQYSSLKAHSSITDQI